MRNQRSMGEKLQRQCISLKIMFLSEEAQYKLYSSMGKCCAKSPVFAQHTRDTSWDFSYKKMLTIKRTFYPTFCYSLSVSIQDILGQGDDSVQRRLSKMSLCPCIIPSKCQAVALQCFCPNF